MDFWIVSIVLLLALFFLISEKLSVDMIGIGIIVVLMISRVLSPADSVAGFANPAVITVGAMFIISQGMIRTGAVGFIAEWVIRVTKGNTAVAMVSILLMVSVASAFINNTPVIVLFIPVIISMCCRFGISPSKYLIPMSYGSILAGTCTLIGTSTNIIISDLSAQYGYGELSMFELSPVGLPIAIAGIVFILIAAPHLMPDNTNPACELEDPDHRRYLAELSVPRGSKLIGKDPVEIFFQEYPELDILELVRYSHVFYPLREKVSISADDILLVKGSAEAIVEILRDRSMVLPLSEKALHFGTGKKEAFVVELIIPPQSSLISNRLMETELTRDPETHVIAIKRSGLHYTEKKIHDIRLRIGDILLVWCPANRLEYLRGRPDYIVVEDVHHEIVHKKKALNAVVIFLGLIIAASTGMADIMVCAFTAALLMILSGCLQPKEAYRALQGDILLLIIGTIALGTAMQQTGASEIYASAFLRLFSVGSPTLILGGFLLLTSISTQILSNNATAVLLLPIAASTALNLGVNPKAFIMAVCFGASACYATPIGYQTNLLVYGPGEYRFIDYLKLGIPLNIIVLILGTKLIPVFWSF